MPLPQAQPVKLPGFPHILLSNFLLEDVLQKAGSELLHSCVELNPLLTYFGLRHEQKMNVSHVKPLRVC